MARFSDAITWLAQTRDDHQLKARFHQERADECQRAIDELKHVEGNPPTADN